MANAVDKEQIAMLSKWWHDYGRGILIAIIIGLIVGFGWKFWSHRRDQHKAKASQSYQVLFQLSALKDTKGMQKQLALLKKDYSDTPYASLGAMIVARVDVQASNYKDALTQLNWVIKHSKVKSFKQIGQIRAARILLNQKQYSRALLKLKPLNDKSFQPMVDSVKGDIYTAEGKNAQAEKAYSAAQKGYQAENLQSPFLNMKLISTH